MRQLVKEYHPVLETQWVAESRVLSDYVRQKFEDYLKCGCEYLKHFHAPYPEG
jgi:hypothetical protein